ncbi:hypothetical protein TNCV_1446071 [Trichonephila clavipes]|nr:hypothetical protein TNCV_1446071 [Trichonephila clavipes]
MLVVNTNKTKSDLYAKIGSIHTIGLRKEKSQTCIVVSGSGCCAESRGRHGYFKCVVHVPHGQTLSICRAQCLLEWLVKGEETLEARCPPKNVLLKLGWSGDKTYSHPHVAPSFG